MAEIFNEQRKRGIVIVPDGTAIYNNQPVIGLREASDGVLFIDNQRVLGVQVIEDGSTIWNEQPVVGAVMIEDGRTMYNGKPVTPSAGGGVTPNKLPFGLPVVFAGDSITAQNFAASATVSNLMGRGAYVWGMTLAGQPMRLFTGSNAGIGGNTSAQLRARYVADVIDKAPAIVNLAIGTNDLASMLASETIANIQWMLDQNDMIGAHTFLVKILPRGSVAAPMNSTQLANWMAVNEWISGRSSKNVTVLDLESSVGSLDANHTMRDGLSGSADYLHPNQLGAYLIGKMWAQQVAGKIDDGSILDTENNALGNLASNGFFTGTGGTIANATGVVANSWIGQGSTAGGATVAYSKVARLDGLGEWQQAQATGTYTGAGKVLRINRALAVQTLVAGDVVRGFCEIELDAGSVGLLQMRMDTDFGAAGRMTTLKETANEFASDEAWSGVLATMPFVLASTPTNCNIDIGALLKTTATTDPISCKFRVGRFRIEKVD